MYFKPVNCFANKYKLSSLVSHNITMAEDEEETELDDNLCPPGMSVFTVSLTHMSKHGLRGL